MSKATAWQAQTKWLSDQRFVSSKRRQSIWTDRVTRGHRESRVTDREIVRKRDAVLDGYGNFISERMTKRDMARIIVERQMNTLAPARRAEITAAQKWKWVDAVAAAC